MDLKTARSVVATANLKKRWAKVSKKKRSEIMTELSMKAAKKRKALKKKLAAK